MALLDANIVEQLKAYFDKIEEPIEIAAFLNDSDKSKELDSFLQEVDAISNKVNYTKKTFGEDKALEETAGITRPTSYLKVEKIQESIFTEFREDMNLTVSYLLS